MARSLEFRWCSEAVFNRKSQSPSPQMRQADVNRPQSDHASPLFVVAEKSHLEGAPSQAKS